MRPLHLLAAAMIATAGAWSGQALAQDGAPDMASLDPDNDGTVDLAEAQKAADALWLKINTDGDQTLEGEELTGRLEGADFTAVNTDGDQTIEPDEWKAVVEARFKAADPDNDGTVSKEEFATDAGKALLSVIQ